MITIIFAPPRTGKTCFMTHVANGYAFDKARNRAMAREIVGKIQSGFNGIKTVPIHCVSANYDMTFKRYRYSPRFSRRINPYRLGFDNPFVKTHFNLPYEVICITEAQKYLNSRLSMYFPDWQSRWYEQHGHNDLDVYLDTQRPMLIDVNIRELSQFIEIVKLDIAYNDFGKPCSLTWHIRRIENSSLFDKYMASGKQDKSCYTTEVITADYNVFACYDSQCCKPKFYQGHFDEDFDYSPSEPTEQTLEGYIRYLEENDDELPEGYYQKRGKQVC
ncbi:MAG: hypothetical protein OSJ67_03615 [Clostridia bacterium]|nr:hypothetical protein [Clostridia bacterium]